MSILGGNKCLSHEGAAIVDSTAMAIYRVGLTQFLNLLVSSCSTKDLRLVFFANDLTFIATMLETRISGQKLKKLIQISIIF